MNKKYFIRSETSGAVGVGEYAVIDVFPDSEIIGTQIEDRLGNQELLSVHESELIVRVTQEGVFPSTFAAILVAYLSNGSVDNYSPGAVENLGQLDVLMTGFQTTSELSWTELGQKSSAPIKSADTVDHYLHEVTFKTDIKRFIKEWAKFADDPLTDETFVAGFAICINSQSGAAVHISGNHFLEYSVRDRPMRTLVRKTL